MKATKSQFAKYELRLIGKRIKQRRKELGFTQPELAALLGLSAPSVSKYENGLVAEASLKKLKEFAAALSVPEGWLLDGIPSAARDIPSRASAIPVLGKTAAGPPIFSFEQYDEYVVAEQDEGVDFAVRVQGDSMTGARIHDGDMVYARSQQAVQNGEIAIVAIDDGDVTRITTKRFYKYGGTIVLRSENPAYKDIEISKQSGHSIRIIGKAISVKGPVR